MRWVFPLGPDVEEPVELLGGKAHGLVTLMRLGLPVPAGFVVGTPACRAYLRDGRFPDGLEAELTAAVARLGPGPVSVRSGAAVSMPGMMNTLLDVVPPISDAVQEIFSSWRTPRAVTYRSLHGIPDDLGTAVVVQRMVHGDRDALSGSGVAFSRDPGTGEKTLYGDVLFGQRGNAVVDGRSSTLPLSALSSTLRAGLTDALARTERHYRDACHVEFTFESGRLWLLQVRPGGLTAPAAVRVAVDLADEELITRREAVHRISPHQVRAAAVPRMLGGDVVARGRGASPGVATGRVALTADRAVRMPGPVILVRPVTSPHDLHGMAAATGIVTSRGGLAGHAAVVARSLGKPAVVDATSVDSGLLPEGTLITIDGTSGEVALGRPGLTTAITDNHLHRLLRWADDLSGDHSPRPAEQRLSAARPTGA